MGILRFPHADCHVNRFAHQIDRSRRQVEVEGDSRIPTPRALSTEEIGADRTGMRLSPGTTLWGIDEGAEGPDLYRHLVAELDKLGLAYLHIMHQGNEPLLADLRKLWRQTLILNLPSRPREQIGSDIDSGLAEMEAYGQMVLANPDFVERLNTHAPLNEADRNSFFGGTARGYTDYPALGSTEYA